MLFLGETLPDKLLRFKGLVAISDEIDLFMSKKADFFFWSPADCEKTTRAISKIPKDSERARASPKTLFLFWSPMAGSGCFATF